MSPFEIPSWPLRLAAGAVLATMAGTVSAQDIRLNTVRGLNPFEPSYIQPRTALETYAEPPAGFLNLPGQAAGSTEAGVAYGIIDSRQVGSIGGPSIWVEVAPIENQVVQANRAVWLPFDPSITGPALPISTLTQE